MEEKTPVNKYSIKELQTEMLILLKAFHKVCMDNNIKYSAHGGTMIGIVREKGFIPWDDDLDVSFTREEFNKLKQALKITELGDEFYFSEYDNAFPQLWMKREGKPAVWVDFFVYDYITESKIGQKIKFLETIFLLGILKNKRTMYLTKKRGIYKGVKYAFIYCCYLLGKLIPESRKRKLSDSIRLGHPGSRKLIHRSNDRFQGVKFVYPEKIMTEYILLPFEDMHLMITEDYDDILRPSYGDYMTPVQMETEEVDVHESARDVLPGNEKDIKLLKN